MLSGKLDTSLEVLDAKLDLQFWMRKKNSMYHQVMQTQFPSNRSRLHETHDELTSPITGVDNQPNVPSVVVATDGSTDGASNVTGSSKGDSPLLDDESEMI